MNSPGPTHTAYRVWDRTTRWFHWINVGCVAALAVLGLAILNAKTFGVSGDGKILLKTLHVYVGYLFAVNLAWRLVWGFVGGEFARWRAVLPLGSGYRAALRIYVREFFSGRTPVYLGHNPLGRLMVSLLLLIMLTQAVTGLVLAGTDLYKPPFGGFVAQWVTAGDADKLALLEPGSKEHVDQTAYAEMRDFRGPFVDIHLFAFYCLAIAATLHVVGVVVTEIRDRHGLTSAMLTGVKTLPAPPVDSETLTTKQETDDGK